MMNEGAPHELSEDWVWTRLGDICQVFGGKRLPKGHAYSESQTNYPYIRVTDFEKMTIRVKDIKFIKPDTQKLINKYTISKEDVYISIAGSIGKVGLIPEKLNGANLTENAAKITNLIGIENKFLCHALNGLSSQEQIKTLTRSTSQPKLALFRIEQIQIPLPPLPEQRAIVSKLEQLFSDLDNGIDNFKKAQAQLKLYRQSVLKAACEGKLVPTEAELARREGRDYEPADVLLARILKERREKWNGKGKYKEPAAPDIDGLFDLPEGWRWIALDQILNTILAGKSFRCDERIPNQDEIGVVKVSAVTWGEFNESESKTCTNSEMIKDDYFIERGDFLFSRANTIELVGACVIVKKINKKLMLSDKILRFNLANIPQEWVLFNLRNKFGRSEIERLATGNQESMRNIGQVRIRQIRIPLPPLDEQHRIVAEVERRLSLCDKMEATITESLQKAESLRQSILKKAFEGKLLNEKELEEARAAPDWEPAEKLLERIKAEKTNTQTKNKGKK